MLDEHEQIIADVTGQRAFVFMVMAFGEGYDLFEKVRRVVSEEVGLPCIRADHIPGSGSDLRRKIHTLIENAALVIADIGERSPNVFYEVGYAYAKRKDPLLIKKARAKTPTDLQGFEVLEHGGPRETSELFEQRLRDHVRVRLTSPTRLVREMLIAPTPHPSLIVAQTKLPPVAGNTMRFERQTFGDNLGVMGLIKAFGSLTRSEGGLELLAAMHCDPDVIAEDANLYAIGSRKTNPVSGWLMDALQAGSEASWHFRSADGSAEVGVEWPAKLVWRKGDRDKPFVGHQEERGGRTLWVEDYGVLIRGPHPRHRGRFAMVMAGAHSLGTGAACLAATRSALLQGIASRLPPETFGDPAARFWVLVRAEFNPPAALDASHVEVVNAGLY
jgi:hypothetical protein